MASADRSGVPNADSGAAAASLLPVVRQARATGFPIRLTDLGGTFRLMQQRRLRFCFIAAGTRFETQGEASGMGVAISIRARLGALPFSAESRPARDEAIALISASPQGAIVGITMSSEVVLEGSFALPDMVTPISLIAALAEWVVNVRPWLSAIARPLAIAGPTRHRAGA